MATGCIKTIVLCGSLPDWAEREAVETAERLGLRVERIECGELPSLPQRLETPPESTLILSTGAPEGLEEARRHGLYKHLDVTLCNPGELAESIEAVSCSPKPAPCPVDAGLGWLQV